MSRDEVCSSLYCYTVYLLAKARKKNCRHPLKVMNVFDFFQVIDNMMDKSTKRVIFGLIGERLNYTVVVNMPSVVYEKGMFILQDVDESQHTHQVCYKSIINVTLPMVSVAIMLYLIVTCILIMVLLWSINRCWFSRDEPSSSSSGEQQPQSSRWQRFLSILKLFNTALQNVSS